MASSDAGGQEAPRLLSGRQQQKYSDCDPHRKGQRWGGAAVRARVARIPSARAGCYGLGLGPPGPPAGPGRPLGAKSNAHEVAASLDGRCNGGAMPTRQVLGVRCQ